MNEVMVLRGAEPREILQTIVEKKVPAIMSYLSRGKWHAAKVLPTDLGVNRFDIKLSPSEKPHPVNIEVDQRVGISLKYGYGKFIFETTVICLEPPACAGASSVIGFPAPKELRSVVFGAGVPPAQAGTAGGGTIVLAMPDRIEVVQRRRYFRVDVPGVLKVNVLLWHRHRATTPHQKRPSGALLVRGWQGRLVDISAGGMQVAVDAAQRPNFKKGQFVGLRFAPMPYETPLELAAQIRSILPTVDGKSICFGLQIVGLEASSEGRHVLQRLCSVVEQYHQINQSGPKQQNFQAAS